jgi:hypothetical protein
MTCLNPFDQITLVIHDTFLLQRLKKTPHVFSNLHSIGAIESYNQNIHDLLDSSLPVAQFQHVLTRPLQPDHALGEKYDLIRTLGAPAATRRQTRLAGIKRPRQSYNSCIRKAPGGGHPGCT